VFNNSENKELWKPENFFPWTNKAGFKNILSKISSELDRIIQELLEYKADLIGFSVFSTNKITTEYVISGLKSRGIKSKIAVGGPQIRKDIDAFYFIEKSIADFSVYTEGEIPLVDILKDKKRPRGTIIKEHDNIITIPPESPKKLFSPDFSDLLNNKYLQSNTLPFMFTRGCPNRCAYCEERTLFTKLIFFDSDEFGIFIKEAKKSGIKRIIFGDSQINPSKKVFKIILNILSKHKGFSFEGNIFASKWISKYDIKSIKRCGFNVLTVGVESGSPRVLKMMNKNISLFKIFFLAFWCKRLGIKLKMNFIIGFPTERWSDFFLTLLFIFIIRPLKPIISPIASTCAALSGSDIYKNPEKYGITMLHTLYFRSHDNDYRIRFLRMKIFNRFLKILGY